MAERQAFEAARATEVLVVPSPVPRAVEGEKALRGGITAAVSLNVATLSENLQRFLASVGDLLTHVPPVPGAFKLEEIQLVVEVNAEGSFQLIGGAKTGVSGGLTLTLRRTP